MNINLQFITWDYILIIAVSLHALTIAYISDPELKTLAVLFPLPFTIAVLSVGEPIGMNHVSGLLLLLIFTHLVRFLHCTLKVPILVSIVISSMLYCVISIWMNSFLFDSCKFFWPIVAIVFVIIFGLYCGMPSRSERAYRTTLPIYIKLPILVSVVALLILMKKMLGGFMTVSPMLAVIIAYECRYSLWAMTQKMHVVMLGLLSMMITCRVSQTRVGIGWALAMSWISFGVVCVVLITCRKKLHKKKFFIL